MTAPYFLGVFATPCSATHFMRLVIEEIGLDVGSEDKPHRDGQVAWTTALQPLGTFRLRLHQVRNPILVISGLQIYGGRIYFRREVEPRASVPFNGSVVRWCAEYWMRWNEHCETRYDFRYRIEDIDGVFPEICGLLHIEASLPAIDRTHNTKREHYEPLTAQQVADALTRRRRRDFVAQCKRYGYEV